MYRLMILVCALFTSWGCSGSNGRPVIEKLDTVPVSGKILRGGKPLANASVRFQSSDGKVSSSGTTDGQGAFVLSTYGAQDGAPVGKYRVTVAVSGTKELEPGVLSPDIDTSKQLPAKYGNPEETPLSAEVKTGADNQFTFKVE
ncbi:MAG: carboxypeptidase-like regulatory domain-containing protein [Bacteroidales bacterium]|nr:carboxypeptidase-like regulatory domain-containing protein [Bacteroidales bacterium]